MSSVKAKCVTVGGMILMGAVATVPLLGEAALTGIVAKGVWAMISSFSLYTMLKKEEEEE